jgi:predicted RNA binding protein YcfA (HicA-like mRNA interferase family)
MTRLPIVDAKTMEKALLRLGFAAVRQKGSHVFYRPTAEQRRCRITPRDLGRPLARSILRDIDLSPEQFAELIRDL